MPGNGKHHMVERLRKRFNRDTDATTHTLPIDDAAVRCARPAHAYLRTRHQLTGQTKATAGTFPLTGSEEPHLFACRAYVARHIGQPLVSLDRETERGTSPKVKRYATRNRTTGRPGAQRRNTSYENLP